MSSFIHFCAEELYKKHGDNLENCLLLFQNRRSILYFRKALTEVAQKPIWAPEMFTLDAWIKNNVGLDAVDELSLLIRLYDCWKLLEPGDRFEAFYTLGQVIIRDFNVMDESMVPRERFFRDLASIPSMSIEEVGNYEPALKDLASAMKESEISAPLGRIWSNLGNLYNMFSKALLDDKLGTPGIIYRKAAESDIPKLCMGIEHTYAIGFYKLNIAEEQILSSFPGVQFFWNRAQDGIMQSLDWEHPLSNFIETYKDRSYYYTNNIHQKSIQIYSAPGQQLQLQALAEILEDMSEERAAQTAVVLPEQGLLLPLLQVIPDNISALNISMGLSVMDTGIYALVQRFVNCHDGWKDRKYIKSELVHQLLDHNVLSTAKEGFPPELLKRGGPLYWNRTSVWPTIPQIWQELLHPCKDQKSLLDICLRFLDYIYPLTIDEMDKAATYHLYIRLQRLQSILSEMPEDWSPAFFANLLRRILQHSRITLQGEPLKGLQVLGSQELANLDFEQLIILDANEGVMPIASHQSCIPHSLAKIYKLPGILENIKLQEQLFWSSIDSAQQISIFYNSSVQGGKIVEPSRWIQRLFMGLHPSNWQITKGIIQPDSSNRKTYPIYITRNSKELNLIKSWFENSRLSPSALNTWLACRLKFYLQYILRYREPDVHSEEMDSSNFGNILHDTMQELYAGPGVVQFDKDIINGIKDNIGRILDITYAARFRIPPQLLEEGSHAMFRDVLKIAINRLIQLDEAILPFTVMELEISLEKEIKMENTRIRFYGKTDRIDRLGDRIRIVDYKTGTFNQKIFRSKYEKIWERDGKGDKEAFQTLFYAWLFNQIYPDKPIPEIHLYFSRGQKPGDVSKVQIDENENINQELLMRFEQDMMLEVASIMSPEMPIDQTSNHAQCSYCPFKDMCGR